MFLRLSFLYFIGCYQDGVHETKSGMEISVKDVQNRPPVFQGSLAAVIDEDSSIGKLVMTIQAKDGDHGQPRKIVYDLLSSKMNKINSCLYEIFALFVIFLFL